MRVSLAREAERAAADLDQVLTSATIDGERALSLAGRIGELRGRELQRLVQSILLVQETLTDEQRRRLKRLAITAESASRDH